MFGDNTGYAASCSYLAEMLERAGRPRDAARFRSGGRTSAQRLDRVAWLGTHFRHWVPEDETVVRDLGVDERAQVSLSNTYSLNRGIRTSRRRPSSAPTGGSVVATARLARGSGTRSTPVREGLRRPLRDVAVRERRRLADLRGRAGPRRLRPRVRGLRRRHPLARAGPREAERRPVWFAYTGAYPAVPGALRFTPVDLAKHANMDLGGTGCPRRARPGWRRCWTTTWAESATGRAGLLRRAVPRGRSRSRTAVAARFAVSRRPGFPERVSVPVGGEGRARSTSCTAWGTLGNSEDRGCSHLRLRGRQARRRSTPVQDRNVLRLVVPVPRGLVAGGLRLCRGTPPLVKLAWSRVEATSARTSGSTGTASTTRTRTGRSGRSTSRAALDGAIYAVAGPDPRRPACPPEGAGGVFRRARTTGRRGAVVYGLVEGLAGVEDRDVAYRVAGVSPRWPAAGTDEARVVVHYPASDGYVAYDYRHDPPAREIALTVTGSGQRAECHVLLPAGVVSATAVRRGLDAGLPSRPPASSHGGRRLHPGPASAEGRAHPLLSRGGP